jgi:DNA-binding protein HU-beta
VTKQEFVDKVADRSGLSRRDAAKAVDAVLDSITDALKRRQEVAFTGFGKFSTQHRAERQGVNPRNPSQKVTIPAATVPKFSAGSSLKQAVRGG